LSAKGFNPKVNFLINIVFDSNIAKVFEPSFEDFKTTNLHLHPKMKRELLRSTWKIHGIDQVAKNEFMIWFVKGYIV
jgi:hypothetical protein